MQVTSLLQSNNTPNCPNCNIPLTRVVEWYPHYCPKCNYPNTMNNNETTIPQEQKGLILYCDICNKSITTPAALLFSPPNHQNNTKKFHICNSCYEPLYSLLLKY